MPNTLAHLGIQGLLTRKLINNSDIKWIFIGCIIPDLPWILQRVLLKSPIPVIDPYYLRCYAIVQSSLFLCLVLCTALALVSANFGKTFKILGLNVLLHLFLDAFQIKWANGVHFLAPFNWQLTNFGFFWPESVPTYLLTGFGLVYLILSWKQCIAKPTKLTIKPVLCIIVSGSIILTYFSLPLYFMNSPIKSNNHFLETLISYGERHGEYIEFDRASLKPSSTGNILVSFAGEEIKVDGIKSRIPVKVSIQGTFVTGDKIQIHNYHIHSNWFRNYSSYLGLILVAIFCAFPQILYYYNKIKKK